MKIGVVICSVGRPEVLESTVVGLARQQKRASEIVVSVVSDSDVTPLVLELAKVVFSPKKGSSAQRNYGVESFSQVVDLVVFLDDDVELCADYFEQISTFFAAHGEFVAISGLVVKDGDITRDDAIGLVAELGRTVVPGNRVRDSGKHWVLYGCNMTIRRSLLFQERFDELLPLYSFAEDYDISVRALRWGRVGRFEGARAVHLKVKGGRVSEFRRGYSMVANNLHFLRKGVCHLPLALGYVRLMLVIVLKEGLADVFGAVRQLLDNNNLSNTSVDFWGRFQGRCCAVLDIFFGRCHPERILDFS